MQRDFLKHNPVRSDISARWIVTVELPTPNALMTLSIKRASTVNLLFRLVCRQACACSLLIRVFMGARFEKRDD